MAVTRPLPVILSVLLTLGLWVYGINITRTGFGKQGVYAALVCGDAYSDQEIRGRLDSQGLTGLVSESDQWFLLDCFGYIEKIPLVEYEERLLPFDPRNDGYAQKVRDFFVHDGKRFIYIPLAANAPEIMETKIARALPGIPYSLEYARSAEQNFLLPLFMVCLAACAFLAIPFLRRLINPCLRHCLPALSPLALGLAPGFAMAALLSGLAALLAEPERKFSVFTRLRQKHNFLEQFSSKKLPAFALIACYIALSVFSELPFLFSFFVLAAFFCVFAVYRINDNSRNSYFSRNMSFSTINVNRLFTKNRRFTPVEILGRGDTSYNFSPVMLPFAAIALALALAAFLKPEPLSLPEPAVNVTPLPAGVVTEADFREHFFFQYTFSFLALGNPYEASEEGLPTGILPAIAGYELSSSGLLAPAPPGIDNEPPPVPDFPLGDFLRALSSKPSHTAEPVKPGNSAKLDLLLALPPALFILPLFIYHRRLKRQVKHGSRFAGFSR
jgi:hypothetical protein